MKAAEWRGLFSDWGYGRVSGEVVQELVGDLERLEHQVAAYREDRLALIDRIYDLEQQVNEGGE